MRRSRRNRTLRQEVGGDRPRRTHGHTARRPGGRIAAAPAGEDGEEGGRRSQGHDRAAIVGGRARSAAVDPAIAGGHRSKSTRLNSSHTVISYAVFCLKKKKNNNIPHPESATEFI